MPISRIRELRRAILFLLFKSFLLNKKTTKYLDSGYILFFKFCCLFVLLFKLSCNPMGSSSKSYCLNHFCRTKHELNILILFTYFSFIVALCLHYYSMTA